MSPDYDYEREKQDADEKLAKLGARPSSLVTDSALSTRIAEDLAVREIMPHSEDVQLIARYVQRVLISAPEIQAIKNYATEMTMTGHHGLRATGSAILKEIGKIVSAPNPR